MNLLSIKDIGKKYIEEIISRATDFDKVLEKKEILNLADGKIMATLFFEPSTRTRMSFETAMLRLGGKIVSAPDMMQISSAKKGETLQDTGRIVSSYVDVIVMRHPMPFSVRDLATFSKVPVINAGDGINEHPSQTLIDLFTIKKELGALDNLKIVFLGDLKYGRTVHSLSTALQYFNVKIYFVSPNELKIPEELREELNKLNIDFEELSDLKEVISEVDVIYQTRVQEERFEDKSEYEKLKNKYIIDRETMNLAKERMILMHPLPRIKEIHEDVDYDQRACYFRQAKNGVPVRMAIISKLLNL